MFSKPLFKQSCKANGFLWIIITMATCVMLAVVMMVMGNANISQIKDSLNAAITRNVVESQVERNTMNLYYMTEVGLSQYDKNLSLASMGANILINAYNTKENQIKNDLGVDELNEEQKRMCIKQVVNDAKNNSALSAYLTDPIAIQMLTEILNIYVFENPNNALTSAEIGEKALKGGIANVVYQTALENYDENMAIMAKEIISSGLEEYIAQKATLGLDVEAFTNQYLPPVAIATISPNVAEYGFEEAEITEIVNSSLINFKVQISVRFEGQNLVDIEQVKVVELITKLTGSLMDELPEDVSNSLAEMGDMDIFALVVGEIFYRIAGILLPMIYIIMAANALIAGQVDSGSMAYTLSTPTRRRSVVFTQMTFLILSLLAMFVCTTIVGVICLACLNPAVVTISFGQLILFNFGAFITLFAIAGVCFMASCWFNRSKHSMAVGGGISMYFLVATILGLFGSTTFPSMIRIDSMRIFSYTTIITLFDVNSILAGGLAFLWKFAILLVIGVACFWIGARKFQTKDLPL